MKYIDADRIRAEIERLFGEYKSKFLQYRDSYHLGLYDGLFMAKKVFDTLEEPDKDLPLPEDTLIFKKGVEEGRRLEREDIEKEWLEDRGGCFLDGVNEGKKAMKEQMLKEAVEGEICHDRAGVDYLDYDIARLDKYIFSRFKFGDKVRIIIVKEDGE